MHPDIQAIHSYFVDAEWRIFQEWYRVCPEEPFEVYFKSTLKRAEKSQGKIQYDLSKMNIIDKTK